ncbi:MAG TPA: SLC45 family MFS transporter [Thermotogota bacterium]|nr:SLC45 family MFS transporter [Thermotogota bacterium]HRW91548.1 SLC45 family MFS transporter [Thermotogota bacterium]
MNPTQFPNPVPRFSYPKTFLLGFGFFGVSLIWAIYNAFVPIFLKDFAISSLLVGFIMTFDNILAVVLQPYIGFLSDHTRTRMGRRMPFILVGAPLGALFFVGIPYFKTMGIFWMIFVIILMNLAMAIFRSPVIALMPDIVPSPQRSKANGIINFMGGAGALLAFFVGAMLYDKNPVYPFLLGGGALLLSAALVLAFIREPAIHRAGASRMEEPAEKVQFGKAFQDLFASLQGLVKAPEKSELFLLLAIFSWFCGYGALETFFTSFAHFHLGVPESAGAMTLGYFSLTFMLFSIPAGFLGSKIGRKRTIFAGLVLLIVVLGAVAISSQFAFIRILMVIGGLGWACININSLPMVVDMVAQEKVGGHTGLYYFFSMAASIAAPPIVGLFIDWMDYPSMIWFSVVAFLIALLLMTKVKRGEARPA